MRQGASPCTSLLTLLLPAAKIICHWEHGVFGRALYIWRLLGGLNASGTKLVLAARFYLFISPAQLFWGGFARYLIDALLFYVCNARREKFTFFFLPTPRLNSLLEF